MNDEDDIVFLDNNNDKKISMEERIELNKKIIQQNIEKIYIRKEKITNLLNSNYAGSKLGGSVWPEKNIYEINNPEGKIYSMSDINLKTFIDFHSEENDIILDPFAGYLNSAEIILKMNRRYIGYEILESYYNKLNSKLKRLKKNREDIGLSTKEYKIFNENSKNMEMEKVDMILTTLPELMYDNTNHKTKDDINNTYKKYLDNLTQPLLLACDRLKDNGFFVIHLKDSVKGFIYQPIFLDITNILRTKLPLKYVIILDEQKTISNLNDEMFKLYSEQIFSYSHEYVLCFYNGIGRLS